MKRNPNPNPNPNPNQVTWEYFGVELPLKFRAGFVGATQDPETKTVSPRVGWYIVREAGSGPRAVFRSMWLRMMCIMHSLMTLMHDLYRIARLSLFFVLKTLQANGLI